jgi:hypothetical protein
MEVLGEKHYTDRLLEGWISIEELGNDTDRGN